MKLEVSEREFHTILAALRRCAFMIGKVPGGRSLDAVKGIATNLGEVDALTEAEIDALCIRLNCGKEE
jgi:hypothetical protein